MLYFHVYFLKVNNKYRDGLGFSFSKWLVCSSLHGDVLLLFRRHEQGHLHGVGGRLDKE
jgi:hypothetical protein